MVGYEGRDLLRDGAARIARECAVEFEPVDRRGALPGHRRLHVVRRHQDQAALEFARVETVDQFGNDDRALYSSPWLPPSRITVGPLPLRITASGTRVTPQASS